MHERARTVFSLWWGTPAGAQQSSEGSLSTRVIRGIAWSVGGAVVSRGMVLVAMIIVGRLLGSTDFGKLGMIQSTLGLFGLFAGTGMGVTATKYVAENRTKDRAAAGEYLSLSILLGAMGGLVSSVLFFVCAPWLASDVFRIPSIVNELRISTALVLLGALSGAQGGALAGLEDFRSMAGINAVRGVLLVALTTTGAFAAGLWGAVVGLAAAEAGSAVAGHIGIRRACRRMSIPVSFHTIDRKKLGLVWQFTLPIMMSSFVIQPALWASNVILVNQPGGYASLGLYSAADKYRQVLLFLPASLTSAVLSLLSNLYGSGEVPAFRKMFTTTLWGSVGVVMVPALLIIGIARFAMTLFGPEFAEGSTTLSVLAASTVLVVLNNVLGQALLSTGRVWQRFLLDVVLGGTLFACACWWIPSMQQDGLALAQCAGYALASVLLAVVVNRAFRP